MTKEEMQQRGEMAMRLLNDALLAEAMAEVERQAIDEMLKAPSFSLFGDRKRRRLADRINTIRGIRAHLEAVLVLGNQAVRTPTRVP